LHVAQILYFVLGIQMSWQKSWSKKIVNISRPRYQRNRKWRLTRKVFLNWCDVRCRIYCQFWQMISDNIFGAFFILDSFLFKSFKDFIIMIDFPLFGHGMRKWKYWWGINLFFAMFRFNPFLTLKDWLIIFLTRFKNWFFNNLTTMESNDWLDLIYVLASRAACTWIVLPFGILLWLRWELTFLLKTESRCEFCKSIFKICHALSKLSVDCLLLFNECMQCFLKISFRKANIRRCISMRNLKIMMHLKWWLWSLCIIVTTLPTEIWVIKRRQSWTIIGWVFISFTNLTHNFLNGFFFW